VNATRQTSGTQLYSPYMDIFSFLIAVWLTQSAPRVLNAQGCVQTSLRLNQSLNKSACQIKQKKTESSAGHRLGTLEKLRLTKRTNASPVRGACSHTAVANITQIQINSGPLHPQILFRFGRYVACGEGSMSGRSTRSGGVWS
jgi:hypothetical protein